MTIRDFSPSDLDACVRLFMDVFSREPWNERWEEAACREHLLEFVRHPSFAGYVMEDGGTINAGLLGQIKTWWNGKDLYINEMFVAPGNQGKGLGRSLIKHAEREMSGRGVQRMSLLTGRDMPCMGFYRSLGFRPLEGLVYLMRNSDPCGD